MGRLAVPVLCGTVSLFAVTSAMAQTDPAGASGSGDGAQLEEIIVTARKREESLQRVPVAVSVVSAEQLKNNLASDLAKIGELAPQVSMSQGGSGTGAIITVRGVSSASNDAGLDQSVAIEVDDVPISRGQVISAAIFDVQQVQVLQGPQALFFGKNSPAGVVSLRSVDPTDRYEGYLTAGYEFRADQRFLEGAVSGPLTDTLKARLAFRASKQDGWIRNVAQPIQDFLNPAVTDPGATMGERGPAGHDYSGRLTLLWTPTADFDAKFKLMMNSQTRNAGNAMTEPFCINGQTQPVLAGVVPLPGADCKKDMVKSHGAVAPEFAANFPYANGGEPYFRSKFSLAALTFNKKLDRLTLTSTTGYYNQTVQQMNVSDWSPYASIWAASKESYRLVTQEVRVDTDFDGPVNFMGGAYYEHFVRPFFNAPDLFHVFNPAAGNYTLTNMSSNSRGEYYSAFGQVRWNIVPTLELAAGARWAHDEKRSAIVNAANNPNSATGRALLPSGQVLRSKFSDNDISPEVTLSWRPEANRTLYAAYKTGYKAGGISNQYLVFANATPDNVKFKPEKARGFEVGYKATTLDRRLRYDLVAYRYNYKDLQVVSYNAETISFTIGNAASARIEGVQGSGEWLATDDLTLRGNFGYNRARYRSYPGAQCYVGQPTGTAPGQCNGGRQDLTGKYLLRAPKFTYSFGADYKPQLLADWDTTFTAQASHSSSYQAATDYAPGGHQKAYWLLNAGARLGPQEGNWDVALIGRNLTNSYYMLNTIGWSGSGNPNQYVGFFNRPREVALQATVRW
ncbi:TonB-dependent receptor [Phenylobacterium sp. LjRoot225]|uniref:TonB-dependent receptor n=1 Tax=Phenylobacterium sp. LjRoot225 TaxID=3342285 RepID=UPI003ECDA57D